ncbi:hypothetical protein L596_018172 [Steinernema carpocapsae]|uniref:G-protein coupled receptors family 1 profile domain-containing protein n=2 Tax=Steinernema carpocapsae TaxID=34508 RepID=A0A4U5N443_STECR|nr:hypothetical protein L596_018172 [Steinernema carpocapsae]
MSLLETEIVLYEVLGILGVIINLPILAAIFWSSQLRTQKEFIIIAGLCISDAINGFSFFMTGVYRQEVVNQRRENLLESRYYCLTTFAQSLNIAVDQAFGWMLLAITLDRLYAVYSPIKYFERTYQYAWTVLGVVVLISVLTLVLAYIFTYQQIFPEVSILCYTSDSANAVLYKAFEITRISTVTLSILLYVPICWKLYIIARQRDLGYYSERRYAMLKNMTITVALSSASSIIFVLVPDNLIAFKLFGLDRFGTYLFALISFKSCINVLIYVLRNPMILAELKRFAFCCFRCRNANSHVAQVNNMHNSMIPSARKVSASAFLVRNTAWSKPTSTAALSVLML